jgi:hypothetical protein
MAREYKVSKAFLSTDDEKQPQIVKTRGGDNHKFMVQVEDQPVEGWMGILKKPGNEIKVGDTLYGDIVENSWGKPQFNRAERPEGNYQAPAQQQAPQSTGDNSKVTLEDLGDKLDYVIGMLENQFPDAGNFKASAQAPDDGPVDLSEIPY